LGPVETKGEDFIEIYCISLIRWQAGHSGLRRFWDKHTCATLLPFLHIHPTLQCNRATDHIVLHQVQHHSNAALNHAVNNKMSHEVDTMNNQGPLHVP
jgi:hypothetical protein